MLLWKLFQRWKRQRAERGAAVVERRGERQPSAPPVMASASGKPLDPEAAVSVRGLQMAYGTFEAVRGVDFDVRRGEVVAFLGPNGAGKTTTVEILEGYRHRSGGQVAVLGQDPAQPSPDWRALVGIVLQDSEPEPYLTPRECLRLYAGYFPRPAQVDEILALVGLEDKGDAATGSLSGGQRRRLDVGLSLIGNPELVFLDEPTTGFDPSARRSAWQMIAGLRDLGKTIFLTTHYMDEAEYLADRILVLAAGQIVAEGTPQTLGGRDRMSARIEFRLPVGLEAFDLPAPFRDGLATNGRATYVTDTPLRDLHALSSWALEAGIELPDLQVRRPTLEDVYLELTGSQHEH